MFRSSCFLPAFSSSPALLLPPSALFTMDFALSRGRRPSPIQIPKLERRREDDEDRPTSSPKAPSLLTTMDAARPTSQLGLEQSSLSWAGGASRLPLSNISVLSDSSPRRTTILQQPITTLQPSAATTTKRESPTRTTFMTVTKSIEEEEETPKPTRTVFISAIPEIVTVTVSQVILASTILPAPAETLGPPKPQSQGAGALPSGAKIPVIALSVVGECDLLMRPTVG